MLRGALQFEVSESGDLLNTARNVDTLRRLWLHRSLVEGEDLGPGDRGDFEFGAWHVSCHLAGAGGVRRRRDGALLWLEITHDAQRDEYFASVSVREGNQVQTLRLDSAEGRQLVTDSTPLGFVEGTSKGRISARPANDSPEQFNTWRRQDFDQPPGSAGDGGKVWEHWCTLRDIRPSSRIGTSVLTAYVSLTAALGDRFPATVARGRRLYGHPVQLAAAVYAGLVSKKAALWNTKPFELPRNIEPLFLSAEPASALEAVERLTWPSQRYYMYKRKIKEWSPVKLVRGDLSAFNPG